MRSTPLLALLALACTPPEDGGPRPLSTGDWLDLRRLVSASDLDFSWIDTPPVVGMGPSWTASNGRGRFFVGERGLTVVSATQARPEWAVGLELTGFGRGAARRAPGAASVWAEGTSFEAVHDGVVEFAEQDSDGFEHGFHVLDEPAGSGPLTLELSVTGARPFALRDGAAFVVQGRARVDWRGLAVFDAAHRPLTARTEVDGQRLRVVIDDRGARYPLLVDPTVNVEEATTALTGGPTESALGFSIASDGDRIVLGDPGRGLGASGVAQIVERNVVGEAWGSTAAPLDLGPAYTHEGFAVAFEGDEILVSSETAGEVQLFRLGAGGEWSPTRTFRGNAEYGWAVDLEDRAVFVSAPGDNEYLGRPDSGAVYVYGRAPDGSWSSQKVLPTVMSGRFGSALSASGERFAVGSPAARRVSLYRNPAAAGGQAPVEELVIGERNLAGFGSAVALDHDVLAVGAPGAGQVLVYERVSSDPAEVWGPAVVVDAPPVAGPNFGARVALTTDTLAVTDLPTDDDAKVHLFERRDDAWGWVESYEVGVADGDPLPITLQPTLLAVGVPAEGTFRVWRRTAGVWSSEVEEREAGDSLGWSAAVSGDLVVVGAPFGGTPFGAGKVYAYVRTAPGVWEARGSRGGSDALEGYGTSVDVAGDLVAVGAPGFSGVAPSAGRVEILRFDGEELDPLWFSTSSTPSGGLGGSVSLDEELLAVSEVNGTDEGLDTVFKRSLSFPNLWLTLVTRRPGQPWDTVPEVEVWNGWVFHRGYDLNDRQYRILIDDPTTSSASQQPLQTILAPGTDDGFAQSMSADGGLLAVGAPGSGTAGKVYLYELTGDPTEPWSLANIVSGTVAGSRFGASVALRGDDLFVGAPGQRSVHHLRRNEGGVDAWDTVDSWATPSGANDGFGSAVASDDATLVVGAPTGAGTAYLYELGATLPPVAAADAFNLREDETLRVPAPGVLYNDHDPDGTPLTLGAVITSPSHGSLQLAADGSFAYTPAANYAGPDSFVYEIADGSGATTQGTVSLTVVPVDDAPIGVPDGPDTPALRGAEDTPFSSGNVSVLDNDTDVDSAQLYAELEAPPERGTLQLLDDGTFLYDPADDDFGPITFTYRVADGPRADLTRGRSEPVLVTLDLAPVNDPPEVPTFLGPVPVQEDVGLRLSHDGGLLDREATGIYDPDGSSLIARLEVPAAHGSVTVEADGSWGYLPLHDYAGPDTFRFSVSDDGGGTWSTPVRVDLSVADVNDAPVAANDGPFHTREDTVLEIAALTLLGNDVDVEEGHPTRLTLDSSVAPTLGRVSWDAVSQNVVYTPNPNASGADVFAYRAVDASNASSQLVQVAVVVDAVNDLPVAVDDTTAEFEGSTSGNVLANDTDPEGLPLRALLQGQPIGGTVTLDEADGSFTYTADDEYFGKDRFTYVAVDADGGRSGLATVELYVLPTDDGTDTGQAPCEPLTWYADADGDGFGDRAHARNACEAPEKHVADDADCDDTRADVNPDGQEVEGDGVDQDCSGADLAFRPAGACDTAPGAPWWAGLALAAAVRRRRRGAG